MHVQNDLVDKNRECICSTFLWHWTLRGLYYKTFNSSKLYCNVSVSHCQSFTSLMFTSKVSSPISRWPEWAKFHHLGYFLRPRQIFLGNMVCCRYLKSLEGVWCSCFRLSNWALTKIFWPFLFGNCFGYFFQNFGHFSPIFWSPCPRRAPLRYAPP